MRVPGTGFKYQEYFINCADVPAGGGLLTSGSPGVIEWYYNKIEKADVADIICTNDNILL